jgi:hypothetical protein
VSNKGTRAGDDNPRRIDRTPPSRTPRGTRWGDDNPGRFDWSSPRWREDEQSSQGAIEKDRREHDTSAPAGDADGAINRKGNRDKRGGNKGQKSRN